MFQQPLSFNLGAAGEIYGREGEPFYVTASFEMNFLISWEERYNVGGEVWLANMLALRGGYMIRYDAFGLTAGAGIKVPFGKRHFTADFAYQEARQGLNVPMRFSVGIGL